MKRIFLFEFARLLFIFFIFFYDFFKDLWQKWLFLFAISSKTMIFFAHRPHSVLELLFILVFIFFLALFWVTQISALFIRLIFMLTPSPSSRFCRYSSLIAQLSVILCIWVGIFAQIIALSIISIYYAILVMQVLSLFNLTIGLTDCSFLWSNSTYWLISCNIFFISASVYVIFFLDVAIQLIQDHQHFLLDVHIMFCWKTRLWVSNPTLSIGWRVLRV